MFPPPLLENPLPAENHTDYKDSAKSGKASPLHPKRWSPSHPQSLKRSPDRPPEAFDIFPLPR